MKIWISKYALTTGISEHEAESGCNPDTVFYGRGFYARGEGVEWHRTLDSAKIRAEDMRVHQIVSLHAKLDKLIALNFRD